MPSGDKGYLVHYLQDFSSAFGSGSDAQRRIAPQGLRAGNEYVIDGGPILRSLFTFGIWDRPWRKVKYEVYPEVGRIEGTYFGPEKWKPEYPNPAFERMRPADAFWAAGIVARFSEEAVRAIVKTGEFQDPAAEKHLADVLLQRRGQGPRPLLPDPEPARRLPRGGRPAPLREPRREGGPRDGRGLRVRVVLLRQCE